MGKGDRRRQRNKQTEWFRPLSGELGPPGPPANEFGLPVYRRPPPIEPTGLPQPLLDLLGRKIEQKERRIPEMITKTTNPPLVSHVKDVIIDEPDFLDDDVPWAVEDDPRRVTLIRDHNLKFPQLSLDVYLVPSPSHDMHGFPRMFGRALCRQAVTPDKADIVVFSGGTDVDPRLYNEKGEGIHHSVGWDTQRDLFEVKVFLECLEKGIPMVGVCRGAQFLHVCNKGKLYQHVDGHQGAHWAWDAVKKQRIERMSSVHHQSVVESDDMEIIAVAYESEKKWLNDKVYVEGKKKDIEAFFYPDTFCLGFQGHPEYEGYPGFTEWSLETIAEMLCWNPDLDRTEAMPYSRPKDSLLRDPTRIAHLKSITKNLNDRIKLIEKAEKAEKKEK